MTATNHVLTSALIGTAVTNPVLALILAFMSHFVLDALPHFGRSKTVTTKSTLFKIVLLVDATFALAFLLSILIIQPENYLFLAICGVTASSPDLMWLPRWLNDLNDKPNRPMNKIEYFHKIIQWGERPWGWIIEIVYFLILFPVFLQSTV